MKLNYGIFLDPKVTKAISNLEALDFDADHIMSVGKTLKPYLEEQKAFNTAKGNKAKKIANPDQFGNIKLIPESPGYIEFAKFMIKLATKEFEIIDNPIDVSIISSSNGKISVEDITVLKEIGIANDASEKDRVEKVIDLSDIEIDTNNIDDSSKKIDVDEIPVDSGEIVESNNSSEEVAPTTNVVDFPAESLPTTTV